MTFDLLLLSLRLPFDGILKKSKRIFAVAMVFGGLRVSRLVPLLMISTSVVSCLDLKTWPVVGILTQETPDVVGDLKSRRVAPPSEYGDIVMSATYVKWIQQAGGLVVPVKIKQPDEYYHRLFTQINGLVLPGGSGSLTTSQYAHVARILYKLALDANSKGDHFPILGICMGFQMLSALFTGSDVLQKCDASDFPLSINFSVPCSESKIFEDLPQNIAGIMETYPITYNDHKYCLTKDTFNKHLSTFYREISTNVARDGVEFISTMESKVYPFYGVQWHPETNNYYWNIDAHNNRSLTGVQLSQFVSNYFIEEARKSHHRYVDIDEQAQALIDRFNPVFLGPPTLESHYFFNSSTRADSM